MRNLDFLTKTKSGFISLFIYFLFTIGVSLQIGGANWDIVWHGSKNVESFLTPPHAIIYSGVGTNNSQFISWISYLWSNHNK